jgi:hypothetical protein
MACKLDHHPNRDQLDDMLVRGVPFSTIRATFGATNGTISRHKNVCLRELLGEALVKGRGERAERGSVLLDRVEEVITEAKAILVDAKAAKSFGPATQALNSITRALELCARLSGELQPGNAGGIHLTKITNVNVTNNYGDDADFAAMVGEATKGFSVAELMRLKAIAENDSVQLACNATSERLIPQH